MPPASAPPHEQLEFIFSFLTKHYPDEAQPFLQSSRTRSSPSVLVEETDPASTAIWGHDGRIDMSAFRTSVGYKLSGGALSVGAEVEQHAKDAGYDGYRMMRIISEAHKRQICHVKVKGRSVRASSSKKRARSDDTDRSRGVFFASTTPRASQVTHLVLLLCQTGPAPLI